MDNFGITATAPVMIEGAPFAQRTRSTPGWPGLDASGLPGLRREERRSFIGGSDANIILSGDAREDPSAVAREARRGGARGPVRVLPVMLGCWTEPFNRQWFEKLSGERVTRVGEHVDLRQAQLAPLHARRRGRGVWRRMGSQAHQRLCQDARRCSSATCPSSSTTWRWPGRSGRSSRSSSAITNMR